MMPVGAPVLTVRLAPKGIVVVDRTTMISDPAAPSPVLVVPEAIGLEAREHPYPPLKLGLMASGTGSNFVAIADAIAQGQLAAQIQVLIYNNPDAPVAQHARERSIPAHLINHRDFAERESFDQQLVAVLQAAAVDWVVMVGWMRRVTPVLINQFPDQILNIHPSLLPSFPGIRAIEQALAHKVKISGCTVHIVRLEVDSGPILMQAAVPVYVDDTPTRLHQRIQQQEHHIIVQTLAHIAQQTSYHTR